MTKSNNTLTYRVGQLEKTVERFDDKLDKIMENHLPHIQRELTELKTRILMFTAINVGAIVLSILFHELR